MKVMQSAKHILGEHQNSDEFQVDVLHILRRKISYFMQVLNEVIMEVDPNSSSSV